MPRGVYERKGEAAKAVRPSAPKVQEQQPAQAPAAVAAVAEPQQFTRDDFRKPIGDMSGALLKAFARSIGIKQRDVDGLTEDRLRQNCTAMQLAALED
jgi:isopenicillin N synthase-like dioxygenase